jgi:hypothetical protein
MQTRSASIFAMVVLALLQATSISADSRADRLIALARAAIGGEGKLATIRGLSAAGTFTKQMPDRVQTGDLQFDLQLPDKLLRTDSVGPAGDGVFMMLRGINGDTLLRNSKILNAGPGARMSRPPLMGATEAEALVNARADLTRIALALLLTAPASMPLEFSSAGVAESPDGTADVVLAKGANGFEARLFLDPKSHRLLMLTYRGLDPRMFPSASRATPAGRASTSADRGTAAVGVPGIVEIALYVDEYRAEEGLRLPHSASLAVDGQVEETWSFKKIRLNPVFGPSAFTDK